MNCLPRRILIACVSVLVLCGATAAHAGLFRTYLSVSGNDANPCSVQQPCRLLPAALDAVNDGGEIWILDSANFNTSTVSITKSVSIIAVPGVLGSVVANGSDAISINAPTSNVTLRNIDVRTVAGTVGGHGVVVTTVGKLSVDSATFESLNAAVFLSGAAIVSIKDSVFRSNSFGLRLDQTGGAALAVAIDRSSYVENLTSIRVLTTSTTGSVRVSIDNSVVTGQGGGNGTVSFGGGVAAAAPIVASIAHTKLAGHGAGVGISSFGAQTVVSLADCHVSGWANGGLRSLNGASGVGVTQSLGNNFFVDNGSNEVTNLIAPL